MLKIKAKLMIYSLIVLLYLSLFSNSAFANYKFFYTVKSVCKVYQIKVDMNDMHLEQSYDSKLFFDLKLQSGRNNFDTVLMVGFIAAGKALENNPEMQLEGVNISLSFSGHGNGLIIASAGANDIVRLVRGDITAAEFKKNYLTLI